MGATLVITGFLAMLMPPVSAQQEFTVLPCYIPDDGSLIGYPGLGQAAPVAAGDNFNDPFNTAPIDPRYWQRWTAYFYGSTRSERISYIPELEWFVMDSCESDRWGPVEKITHWFAVPVSQGAGKGWIQHSNAAEDDCAIGDSKTWKSKTRIKDFCEVKFNGKTYVLSSKNTGKSLRCSAESRLEVPWAVGRTRANGQVVGGGTKDTKSLWESVTVDTDKNVAFSNDDEGSARQNFNYALRDTACFDPPKKPGKYKYKVRSGQYFGPSRASETTYCNAFRCYTQYSPARGSRTYKNNFDRTFQVKVDTVTVIPKS